MDNVWFVASICMGLALLAGLISAQFGVSVALAEILVGVAAGNLFGLLALSTTSVAVVYAVIPERGLAETELGKLILAACFVTDFGTVLALGLIFATLSTLSRLESWSRCRPCGPMLESYCCFFL